MLRRIALIGASLAVAACPPSPPSAPAPDVPAVPPAVVPGPSGGPTIHLAPGSLRYAVHYQRRVEQEIAGQQPTVMGYRAFISAHIAAGADVAGYAVTHFVDSIIPDSGSFVPPTVNFHVARGLRLSGRLAPSGAVSDVTPSDSVQARFVGQFLGSMRDFYPRVPPGGLRPGSWWSDTTTTTERSAESEVVLRAVLQHVATGWEERSGQRSVRVEVEGTYTVLGTGEQGGQPFELTGSGTRWAVEFVSKDGRYLGGEARDSSNLSVALPAQGMTVPIRQTLRSTITVLP